MRKSQTADVDQQAVLVSIQTSSKYRDAGIPDETILDIYQKELLRLGSSKKALDSTRKKLHHITAFYLGEPDYKKTADLLADAARNHDEKLLRDVCQQLLLSHTSTRERWSILADFYQRLFEVTGVPASILDLACGMNPFAIPWMGLPPMVEYHAYDLNLPRIKLINQFLAASGMLQLADHRDFLIHPPEVKVDVAFLFKEVHRMEDREKGCTFPLLKCLQVRWILISLPTASMSGRHDLLGKHRKLITDILAGSSWQVSELLFPTEAVFCVDKG